MKDEKPKELNPELVTGVLNEMKAEERPSVSKETLDKRAEFYRERFIHYGYDEREPYNLRAISRYCANLFSGTISRGLCLVGPTGVGKTFAFEIMRDLFRLRIYHAADLVDTWQRLGVKDRGDLYKTLRGNFSDRGQPAIDRLFGDICIDDVGTEPTLNDFGTKQEVIDTIFQRRAREFNISGARTHMAINLPAEEIRKRYNDRFVSRLHQLCYVITLRGDDRRKDGK